MGLKEGSGADKAKFGGRDFGKSQGSSNYLGKKNPKIPTLPDGGGSGAQKAQSNYLGQSGSKGVPKKGSSGGWTSKQSAAHDDADA